MKSWAGRFRFQGHQFLIPAGEVEVTASEDMSVGDSCSSSKRGVVSGRISASAWVHLVGIRQDFSVCLGWFKPAFVRGCLLSVGIFKGCVQVGPVRSLQLALDFCLELFAQDLQFLCALLPALLPHLLENMDPPLDEPANEEWARSRAYSPWPEPACMRCSHWLRYEECLWTGSTFLHWWLSPSVVPSCQPGQSWLSLVGPSPPSCTVEWDVLDVHCKKNGPALQRRHSLCHCLSQGKDSPCFVSPLSCWWIDFFSEGKIHADLP